MTCVVTGGSGFVGRRLVEMLAASGREVISFDRTGLPPTKGNLKAKRPAHVRYVVGDICSIDDLAPVCEGAACVWHLAAAVGPYHPQHVYRAVNLDGTLNVIEACRRHGVPKIVMATSPSTRFQWGVDVDGQSEEELPALPMRGYMQAYAETKAQGELALRNACCDSLMTVTVAPHQVYGPRDTLFLSTVLENGAKGRLRAFGSGQNRVAFTYVDNYCHALMLAEKALRPGSKALGGFYIVTDGDTHPHKEGYAYFWQVLDDACTDLGMPSFKHKWRVPLWLMYVVAYASSFLGWLTGASFTLNPFSVRASTMHRWFRIGNAERDLNYKPLVPFGEAWGLTMRWFQANWQPESRRAAGR